MHSTEVSCCEMTYNPFDFVRTQLANRMDRMFILGENEAADDGKKSLPGSESATGMAGMQTQDPSGQFTHRQASRLNPRAAVYEPHQRDQKPTVSNLHDLALLMKDGYHETVREGISTNSKQPQIGCAVLFEVAKNEASSLGSREVRYLPLIRTGSWNVTHSGHGAFIQSQVSQTQVQRFTFIRDVTQSQGSSAPTMVFDDGSLDVLSETKRYIESVQTSRILDDAPKQYSQAELHSSARSRASLFGSDVSHASQRWPAGDVPVELFDMITKTLSHRDIRNMRLVCKEFEAKTSPSLFKEVVVPFTAELYDMIEDDVSARLCNATMRKSERSTSGHNVNHAGFSSLLGAPDAYLINEDGMYSRKSSQNTPKHGLRIFQGFGPHMNKFGIRFEVSEADLSIAQVKKIDYKQVDAYHGVYPWPPPGYARFGRLANLERTADETPRMTAALATLINIREIGLSLDSGLGFVGGPDRSYHDIVFERPTPVFEETKTSERPSSDGVQHLWSCLRQSYDSFNPHAQLGQERLVTCILTPDCKGSGQLPTVSSTAYDDTSTWPTVKAGGVFSNSRSKEPIKGILYTTTASGDPHAVPGRSGKNQPLVSPASLTDQQNQWLLEMGWAQSAFLDTYILALTDNPQIFHQITKVSISKISSGLLDKLDRDAFWSALPNAKDVTLLVSPDWRTVCKDEAGCAVTLPSNPSSTLDTFAEVVHRISLLDDIKKLRIGYTEGGENGKGLFGRNTNLMPAPITDLDHLMGSNPDVLSLDHIEDVTLVNCWITPRALLNLTTKNSVSAIAGKTLTFDSVSLTANTRPENAMTTNAFAISPHLTFEFREGCWPSLVHALKRHVQPVRPDEDSLMDLSPPGQEAQPTPAAYKRITFNSCGYVWLPNIGPTFDQQALGYPGMPVPQLDPESHGMPFLSEWHRRRLDALRPHMQSSKDDYLGRIVPFISPPELALLMHWQMHVGPLVGEGEDAEFDCQPRRGTGRFWGHVQVVEE